MRWQRVREERGTMIPMYVLFVMIAMGLLTIVLDSTQVYVQRRALQSVTDGASLAAADGINETDLYDKGLDEEGQVRLVESEARAAVNDYQRVVNQAATEAHQHVSCDVGDVQANRVQVECTRSAVMPVVNYISQGAGLDASVEVNTVSWADASLTG